jgi:hypothetical protein
MQNEIKTNVIFRIYIRHVMKRTEFLIRTVPIPSKLHKIYIMRIPKRFQALVFCIIKYARRNA